jgi:hypothetical protein
LGVEHRDWRDTTQHAPRHSALRLLDSAHSSNDCDRGIRPLSVGEVDAHGTRCGGRHVYWLSCARRGNHSRENYVVAVKRNDGGKDDSISI